MTPEYEQAMRRKGERITRDVTITGSHWFGYSAGDNGTRYTMVDDDGTEYSWITRKKLGSHGWVESGTRYRLVGTIEHPYGGGVVKGYSVTRCRMTPIDEA